MLTIQPKICSFSSVTQTIASADDTMESPSEQTDYQSDINDAEEGNTFIIFLII